MKTVPRMAGWLACAAAAALAACTSPATTNNGSDANAVAEANAAAEAEAADTAAAAGPEGANAAAPAESNAAAPAKPAPRPAAAPESYAALGQEPGWALKIGGGRIDYSGNYGEKKINIARPEPIPRANGRRYVSPRLTVDVTYARCNNAMSGFGFEHQVTVTADGETYKGCGGARKKQWDM